MRDAVMKTSSLANAGGGDPVDGFPLRALAELVVASRERTGWTVSDSGFWCRVGPAKRTERVQGWKLHVSATPLSAALVLHRAATVLVEAECEFKFAADIAKVEELTSSRYHRAQAGKFITAYPRDDEQFADLAQRLDIATAGLPGPRILSDRPVRTGSVVHYRYGAFTGIPTLTNDGVFEARIERPDGVAVADSRSPWFAPPAWAETPAGGVVEPPAPRPAGKPVLLNDRYAVREAIRHSARGGVYRADDRRTGSEVIIKQARAHIGALLNGQDARDALRREARLLRELDGLGPDVVEVFEQDEHVFLAETAVPGQSLGEWVYANHGRDGDGRGLELPRALELARRLTALLAEVHARDVVFRDFTPGNVMLTPTGALKLIDPEIAARPGEWTYLAYTPGYAAPEAVNGPKHGPAPELSVDLYSLGTALFYLVTGVDPVFPDDEPGGRSHGERLAEVLRAVAGRNTAARVLAPVVLGLTTVDPSARWSLERTAMYLVDLPSRLSTVDSVPDRADRLIEDGLAHILATMTPGGERLWPSGDFGQQTDPCNVQHGAAGVLGVLTRASAVFGSTQLRDGVAAVAKWIDERRDDVPVLLPGLHFGRSGAAWAMLDAGLHLDDADLVENASALALRIPVRWPNPDVCHGAAGSGMTQLHFWHETGRMEFLERVEECADGLLAAAISTDEGVFWPVPEDFDSNLAGIRHYGFGHGVAGVGAFLLAAAEETGREVYLQAARAAGDTLAVAAVRQKCADGSASTYWRTDQRQPESDTDMRYHWCSGSSGIGTFLLRLGKATGAVEYLALAREAAVAVRRSRWSASTVACHGLAGNGEFLLDLGGDGAEDLASCISVRATERDGLLVLPDESRLTITVDYGTGLAGAIGFLLRLRHGGPRWWMPEREVS
ncbi:class IV lanthionine synthetase LanL [Allokutzneria sp. NRRL B-24872]|uniref:class IV lanthionine synthetase LanL n=1 Tax=Allokutzneria sp. NRRL B-24872 TaxID=1137961 RepID=UPI000A3D5A3D|nr:class IV lanthionine synthetase LanL [Allokutzneria sp. NRRL B-24872]